MIKLTDDESSQLIWWWEVAMNGHGFFYGFISLLKTKLMARNGKTNRLDACQRENGKLLLEVLVFYNFTFLSLFLRMIATLHNRAFLPHQLKSIHKTIICYSQLGVNGNWETWETRHVFTKHDYKSNTFFFSSSSSWVKIGTLILHEKEKTSWMNNHERDPGCCCETRLILIHFCVVLSLFSYSLSFLMMMMMMMMRENSILFHYFSLKTNPNVLDIMQWIIITCLISNQSRLVDLIVTVN